MEADLKKIGFFDGWIIQPIRKKFGISVFRITKEKESYVGKYFDDQQIHGRQEIQHYKMLRELNIPTLEVIAHTNSLVLMEDVATSTLYRLGIEQDMSDVQVACLVAQWFKQLHTRGKSFFGISKLALLDKVDDAFNHDKITKAITKSNTHENPFWDALLQNINEIKNTYISLCNTITYNDFWWDNLVVAKDFSTALMFDYNCISRKYAYADVRHILSVLSKEAGAAFIKGYGDIDEGEKVFEELYFPLTGIVDALNLEELPSWANTFIEMLHNGELMQRMNKFEEYFVEICKP